MSILDHVCLKVSIEVLRNLIEEARVSGRFMIFILPSFAKFVCAIHFG